MNLFIKQNAPPKPRYCNDFSVQELVDWAEMEVEYEGSSSHQPRNLDVDVGGSSAAGDVGRSSVPDGEAGSTSVDGEHIRDNNVDKGKEKVTHDEEETDYDSEVDSEYDSDKSIDYLSPGEEELIELRKRIKARREKEHESLPDMMEVNDNIPTENIGNHRSETFREHDVYMTNLMKTLQSSDENGIHDYPFVCVEKHADRYPVYDESTHWRLRNPKVCFHLFDILIMFTNVVYKLNMLFFKCRLVKSIRLLTSLKRV